MSLNQITQEELQEMSLMEIAFELLKEKKQPVSFKELMDEITKLRGLTEDEVRARIAQFYTDLNIDGRFMTIGENRWGLRVWYPVDQTEEEHVTAVKPKKKKAKKVVDEDEELDIEEYDELEEEELDYDDVDDDFDEDDDDDLLEDDVDEDLEEDDEDLLEDDEEEFDLDEEEDDEDLEDDDFDAEDDENL
ncbi:DNA-directed RNA polymerase subunit delta [Robertmurraya korlensis]|uniref:DNA-directed RNA polymerase subunit delta n=1 Tax=Robertmurraya korlensis TaxID=519977 RepID=UPI000826B63D|nr:DNA-directed RNA polymerase subunit delta [Robertmurraya korlensis]